MIFTTDDVNPEFLDFWKKYLDPVHEKYSNFKVIAFVVPYWHDKKENHVMTNPHFLPWLSMRSDWVTIAAHGLNHLTSECLQSYDQQLEMMKTSKQMLQTMLTEDSMFKPPYYKWNSDSLFAAKEAGFRWFFTQDGILDLHNFIFHSRLVLGLIDSHCNPTCEMADRIDRVAFDKLLSQMWCNRLASK